MIGSGERKEGG
jgi:hypothetical protein